MDRLVEHLVAWHNRHPLAKKITIYDVHTMGVVALPFLRGAGPTAERADPHAEPIEPVLGDSTLDAHANTAAQHLDALADQEEPPTHHLAKTGWRQRLTALAQLARSWRGGAKPAGSRSWPAFSERFVKIAPRRVATFAQRQGFLNQPGDASWPQRVVPIDEKLMSKHSGAWPYELYLLSAAIDAGRSRSRVLIGMGRAPAILGSRCWSPQRMGLAAMVLLGLLGLVLALLLPRHGSKTAEAAAAASAPASVPASSASASAPTAASAAVSAAIAASAPMAAETASAAASVAASAPEGSASAAASAVPATQAVQATQAASTPASGSEEAAPAPDIRPQLVTPLPKRTPLARPAEAEADKPAKNHGKEDLPAPPRADKPPGKPEERNTPAPAKPGAKQQAGQPVVALVGPVSADKAAAEALLARMLGFITPLHPGSLHTSVVQTPEGWRPAVWPFDSRQEAQLINATLVARGMKTKAVDF